MLPEECPNIVPLIKELPASVVYQYMLTSYFAEESVTEDLKKLGSPPELVKNKYHELREFLSTKLVTDLFMEYWQYETDSRWEFRSATEALRETAVHALTIVACMADIDLFKPYNETRYFPELSTEDIQKIAKKAHFLTPYLNTKIR